MADLSIAILGLGRLGSSVGLALKRYQADGGQHNFAITGYDNRPKYDKIATEQGAVDRIERRISNAVAGTDIVVMTLPYEEVKDSFRAIAHQLRDGVVVLDMSTLKMPSLDWSKQFLSDEHHLVGMTPILNPAYLYHSGDQPDQAAADLFDEGAVLLSPAPNCAKDAVDLAFNFVQILGSKARFYDPDEHDTLIAFTEQLPAILGTALFYTLMKRQGWGDMQQLTNPNFGVLTRILFDQHPDGLRDEWLGNREILVHALDTMIQTMSEFRGALADNDLDAIEAAVVDASGEYERWLNRRHKGDWDGKPNQSESNFSLMGGLLGEGLAKRLRGSKNDSS